MSLKCDQLESLIGVCIDVPGPCSNVLLIIIFQKFDVYRLKRVSQVGFLFFDVI